EVTGLSKTFGAHTAVDDVSLNIPKGATLGLVGETGSGKTTIARMILGLTPPDAGSVKIFGHHFAPAKEVYRRGRRGYLGAIYQYHLASSDQLSSVPQIVVNALSRVTTTRSRPYRQRDIELLDMGELVNTRLGRHPSELSRGQPQLLAIARALEPFPEVLIL